jgi:signal peptidase I
MHNGQGREIVFQNFTVISRPIDKEDNYVKRCVGIPGDTLRIVNAELLVNGKPAFVADNIQLSYDIQLADPPSVITDRFLQTQFGTFKKFGATDSLRPSSREGYQLLAWLKKEDVETLRKQPFIRDILQVMYPPGYIEENMAVFPHSNNFKWNRDNFGPMWIPKQGATVKLDTAILPLYRRIIEVYEENKLEVMGDKIYLNGQETRSYTFRQDYYWMMGDNRHNSLDSRYWGFVPNDHVVGKAVFVWMSLDQHANIFKKFRWSRAFSFIGINGPTTPLVIPLLFIAGCIYLYLKFRRKKKETKQPAKTNWTKQK